MSKRPIEQILREAFRPELPYGFPERVAYVAFTQGRATIWDLLVTMSPRTGLAFGLIAVILVLFSMVGEGPGLIESLNAYVDVYSLPPIF